MDWQYWINGFAGASALEWVATITGFLCVFLLVRRNIWTFGFGFVQVTLYTWIFWQADLYAESVLHLFYMAFQVYGFLLWHRSDRAMAGKIRPIESPWWEWGVTILIIVAGTYFVKSLISAFTQADYILADAFIASASLTAQWLLSHRRKLNWLIWIAVDCVAIGLYMHKGLFPTVLLYNCFLVMCMVGWWQWHKASAEMRTNV